MSNIDKRLKELFEKHNIIFWYDDEGNLQEEFDSLEIDVIKLLIDDNQFNIKYQILKSAKNSKYLVYSNKKEPAYDDNWLLDLQLKSYLFSADRASIILSDLGLDIVYKPFITRHIEFFTAKTRVDPFVKLIDPSDDAEKLAIKMLAALSKCSPKIEHIAINLMINDKAYTDICKYELEDYLWKNIKYKYQYDVENPTLKDFTYKLLQNHFFSSWDKNKCELNKEAVLFVKNWMDSSTNKESFRAISKSIQSELAIESIVQTCSIEDMLECDTYELCEQMLISNISKALIADSTSKEKIIDICTNREHTFWYASYENIYKAFLFAIKLETSVKSSNFLINSFDDGLEKYVNEFSKVDYYYRKYIKHSNKSEHNQILKALDEKIERIYLNDFLRDLNNIWQSHVKDYKNSKFSYQKDFYKTNVTPIAQKDQKVFVIISDALRFECAVELKNRILGLNRYSAKIEPMVGVLPSFTQLGVASLLPNETLSFNANDDTVYVDNISSRGTKNREKILKNTNEKSVYTNSESFLSLNRETGREFIKENQIVYIYHNEIDATGDKKESEHKVFEAVEDSFITIKKIIKQISNFNGSNIFITSDHGFLYQDTPTLESEFFKAEKADDVKRFNRRFIIGSDIQNIDGIDIFDASDLNIAGDDKIGLVKSINKIKLQGGGHRFVHGGSTLQEMVVPLICVKKMRKDDVTNVEVSCIPISQITTNSVMLSFYQEEPISDKIKPITLKIAFYSKDDKLISTYNSYSFNSTDTHDRNREVKLKFDLKQNASNYSGQNIKIVMKRVIEDSNEEPLYKEYEIKLQLSFINDFDEF